MWLLYVVSIGAFVYLLEAIRTDGSYLFIMYPKNGGNLQEVRKDCVTTSRNAAMYGGRFVGIASKVFRYDYQSSFVTTIDGVYVVFYFPSRDAANSFFRSDPKFKQPKSPPCAGKCQAWVVDRKFTPDNEGAFNTFLISQIRLRNPGSYMRYNYKFVLPFADLLLKYRAHPYVVQTPNVMGIRGFYKDPSDIVTVHLFRSPHSLDDVLDDGTYEKLKKNEKYLASEISTVFTIDQRTCS